MMIDFPLQGMMIGPDGVPIPIPVEETKLEMDGYFGEAGYEDEYQEEYIPYQVPENYHSLCSLKILHDKQISNWES